MSSCTRPWPVLVLCCVLTFSAMGIVFGMGAIFTDIMNTYDVSRATASLVQSVCLGMSFGIGLLTGNFVEWKGPRVTVITGSVLATAGCVIAFLATGIVQVIVGIGVIAGIGISFIHLAAQMVTGIVFCDMKGLALSLFSICTAGGSVFFPLVLRHVTNYYSLRGTFLIMAAIYCQVALCGALIGIFAPRTPGKTAVTTEPRKGPDAAGEAGVTAGVDGDEERNGNSRMSDDEREDRGGSVDDILNDERARFVARDWSAADGDGVWTDSRLESEASDDKRLGSLSERSVVDTELNCHLDDNAPAERDLPEEEKVRLMPKTERNSVQNPRNSISSLKNSFTGSGDVEDGISFEDSSPEKTNDTSGDSKKPPAGKLRSALNTQLEILRNVQFVVFAVFSTSAFLFFLQPMMFMTDMVKSNQMTAEDGSFFLTVMFIGSVTGRMAAGLLQGLLRSRIILFVNSASIMMGGMTCVFYSLITEYLHFIGVSFIYGLSYGLYGASAPMAFLEILGPGRFAVGMGYMATVAGVFVLLAGPYGGTIRDMTNSYELLYYIACAHGLLVALLLIFTAYRCRHRS